MNIKPEIRDLRSDTAAVGRALAHDSAAKHVTGTAIYIDDAPEPAGTLHLAPGLSPKAKGRILSMDLSAVRAAPGVVTVLTAADIPGVNDCSPSIGGDPILANGEVLFHGQVVFCVVAQHARRGPPRGAPRQDRDRGRKAGGHGERRRSALGLQVLPDYSFGHGDTAAALRSSVRIVEGAMKIGGQEHFYLEGQISACLPGEGGEMKILLLHAAPVRGAAPGGADAWPARRTDHVRVPAHGRRLRWQGKPGARNGRALPRWPRMSPASPCKMRLDRDDDFITTGKRHDFDVAWRAGIDDNGRDRGGRGRLMPAAAAIRRICRWASTTARCSTPTTPISIRQCGSFRAG